MPTKKNILKFKKENASVREGVKETLHRKSGARLRVVSEESHVRVKGPDWKLEKLFVDAWLMGLEMATMARVTEDFPNEKEDFYIRNTMVVDTEDDKYVWVGVGKDSRSMIGCAIRFAVPKRTGVIHYASSAGIGKAICPARDWDQFNWKSYYPNRKISYDYSNNRVVHHDEAGEETGPDR